MASRHAAEMIRTFLAVEIRDSLRAALAQLQRDLQQRIDRDLPRGARLSWVRPASLHITMKFLGDIDEELVEPLREAIGNMLAGHRAVHIPLHRLGVFPRIQQPRVLWVGPSEGWEKERDAARLASLHRAVEDCCGSLNLAPDSRPLSPHLTLARIRDGGRSVGQALAGSGIMDRPLDLGSLVVDSIALMKSDLRPDGSVYTRLWDATIEEG